MGFLLQPLPWQRQVFVPFKTAAWHFELYWEELENGGRRKQLVNITTLLFFQRHVARQRSLFLLQSFVRRQLLLQTPVVLLQCANDSRQDAHELHCVLVISASMSRIPTLRSSQNFKSELESGFRVKISSQTFDRRTGSLPLTPTCLRFASTPASLRLAFTPTCLRLPFTSVY